MTRVAITAAIIAACSACSSCHSVAPSPAGTNDGGTDGGDAAVEASGDDGFETGGLLEAATDAAADSPLARGKWAKLAIYPDCPPTIALNPEEAISPLTWVPCASGRAGCRNVLVDWTSRTDIGPLQTDAIRVVDGSAYVPHGRWSHDYSVGVIQKGFDGPAVFASVDDIYAPISCAIVGSIGKAGVAFAGYVGGKSRPTELDRKTIVGHAMWGSFTSPVLRFADNAEFGATTESGSVTGVYMGDRRSFYSTYLPSAVQPFDHATLKPIRSMNVSAYPTIVPDGALASGLINLDLVLIRDDGSFVTWTSPEPWTGVRRAISWHSFDQTTGDTVAWIEVTLAGDGTALDPVLWTAAYIADPAKVVRRKVGKLPVPLPSAGRGMLINGGLVLIAIDKDRAGLYRVSDGVGWSIAAEAETVFAEPRWVDDVEVFIDTMKPGEKPSNMLRLRRDVLGVPTVKILP